MNVSSRFFATAAAAVSALAFLVPKVSAAEEGECVCHEGFIMDRFCINRGVLLDTNGVPTLENPAVHTMHCLWDIPVCINSGYTVLADPEMAGERFTVAAQFDSNGDALVTEFGVARGDPGRCSQCTGELGQQTEGFRATIIGRIETLGNAESDDPLKQASTLAVTEVLESSVGCAAFTCPEVVEPDAQDEGGTTTTLDEVVDDRPKNCEGKVLKDGDKIGKNEAICIDGYRFGINSDRIFGLWDGDNLVKEYMKGADRLIVDEQKGGERAYLTLKDKNGKIIWQVKCPGLDGDSTTKLQIKDHKKNIVRFRQGDTNMWKVFHDGGIKKSYDCRYAED